ncbi:MAG: hypothetical protein AAF938_19850, partial [Myxococcota bacterium]
ATAVPETLGSGGIVLPDKSRLPKDGPGLGTDARGRHGFYDVVSATGRYGEFPQAVLLNYGSGRNAATNPEARIRDYLVQVDPNNPDLFLGKAYLNLGLTDVFSNFFVLERLRPAPGAETVEQPLRAQARA